jgi:broad specificity phosphatase PhoE
MNWQKQVNQSQLFPELRLMKTFLYVSAFLALFGPLKMHGADPQPAISPVPPGSVVETIVFLRHGEKPEKEIGQLNCQGLNRALALPRVLTSKFGRPDYLFAPAASRLSTITGGVGDNYLRPLATIEPTAIELGMPVNADFAYSDIDGLRTELTEPKYQKALIFVAWEHHQMEKLVKQLVGEFHGDPNEVPKWKGEDFDSLYILRIVSRDTAKSISFTLDHEGLSNLSTDCPDPK